MRLHTLELQAFGPYSTPQVIDFDRLASSGLFLLEGPTGAGKSTILDAITYALYGRLSATSVDDDRLHSDFAHRDVEPAVALEFSIGGTRFRIRRTPEYERPKHRGEGTTTAATTVHLQRLDGEHWTSLSAKTAEVADVVIDVVGLDADQFRQVALLPQGEFAKFLHAKDDERGALLTKLFGADLYTAITKELQGLAREATKSLGDAEVKIKTASAVALAAAGYDSDTRDEVTQLPLAERDLKFVAIDEDLHATVVDATTGREGAATATDRARSVLREAETTSTLMTKLVDLRADQEAHESTRAEQSARVDRLALARRALPVAPLIDALATADLRVGEVRAALREIDSHPTEELLDGIGADESAKQLARLTSEADQLLHHEQSERGLPAKETAHQKLVAEAKEAANALERLEVEREKLPAVRAGLDAERQSMATKAAGLTAMDVQRTATKKQLDAANQLVQLTPQAQAAQAERIAAKDAHLAAIDAHQQLFQSRLDGMRAELASLLVDGQQCPVCGSLDHPQPSVATGAIVSEADVGAAKENRETKEDEFNAAAGALGNLTELLAAARAVAGERTVEELTSRQTELALAVAEAKKAEASVTAIDGELAAMDTQAGGLESKLLTATANAIGLAQQITISSAALELVKDELSAAAGDFESVAARHRTLIEEAGTADALTAALRAVRGAVKAAAEVRSLAERTAQTNGFEGLEEAQLACVGAAEMATLDEHMQAWNREETRIQIELGNPDLAGIDPVQADSLTEVLERARTELDKAQDAARTAQSELANATQNAQRFAARMEEVRTAVADHEDLRDSTATVIRLDKLARGMEGHRRVELKAYVLRRWFEQVVTAANLRLATMSSGRYELSRVDESSGRANARTGLTLVVVDRHTGKSRSPRSLSGGETFFTSLSLALGLADVVKAEAGGVDLDTLFIDEGFGTLDAETLDHVMAVIDELRDRGRVVGIVSHVAELKDRVPERLEVRRNKDGSSSVRVVA